MKINCAEVRKCLKSFDFKTLFREHLGWDNHQAQLDVPIDGSTIRLNAVAQKRGFIAFVCPSIPDRATRLKLDHQIAKSAREHFVIYTDEPAGQQVWQWVRREPGRPKTSRDHRFEVSQPGERLIQRLEQIAVSLTEEEETTLPDMVGRARAAFDVDKVTKKFYDRFKDEHKAFQKLIKGIKTDPDLQWYASLMLNRLMFVYFIQKKGFLDGDTDYLRNRLKMVQQAKGKDKFQSFYRYFLLRLFHEGLGKSPDERKLDPVMEKLLGNVPFLNGGFFEVHLLEEQNPDLDIPDKAFQKLFDFFDQYSWHLDERPLRADNEINPDVVGYIFEKYINQKQMGAYYTKEDITEYISKNTIIPFLFDTARNKCAVAFNRDSALWRLLQDDPDRYIYPAVRYGVIDEKGDIIPLPKEIEAGVTDVGQRDGWNRPATDPYSLPTETWREHVARRQRCLDIRKKLHQGEVHEVNDLVTLNLDIWQFARDAIVNAEGPDLLRAFWHTIAGRIPDKSNENFEQGITVLDPTCGSGAFLFAALRILETLYSDCLERMERFIEDIGDKAHHPEQYGDFGEVLAQTAKHPNEQYFILKSIIINNLFGVDIMPEAVEICKLRLFLKLVAQVETVEQIEPLPDIDFNVRTGNALVGFASLEQLRELLMEVVAEYLPGTPEVERQRKHLQRIEEDAEIVEKAFQEFRAQQTAHSGKITHGRKQRLRNRLAKLDAELDCYLAGEYGVDTEGEKDLDRWRANHLPFHWFVEFYGIMHAGGFDVVIGNPPYVELTAVSDYRIIGYRCIDAGNLYALMIERSFGLQCPTGRMGFIVPVSSVSTDRYEPLQALLSRRSLHYSSFDDRPSRLFDGLEHIRLTIHLIGARADRTATYSTCYNKWSSGERTQLFQTLAYTPAAPCVVKGTMPKLSNTIEQGIIRKLVSQDAQLSHFYANVGGHEVFYSRKVGYFLQVLDFAPEVRDGHGHLRPPSEFKELRFVHVNAAKGALACLNSNLFYWFITVFSDCRHVNKREVDALPVDLKKLAEGPHGKDLGNLAAFLMQDLRANSEYRTMRFRHDNLTVQCIIPRYSKRIVDDIDRVLAQHYGFTDEELDFIINYDIKYRMGQDSEDGGED